MVRKEFTRRGVLRTGGQLTAAAAVASTAGCLGSIPFVGGSAVSPKKWVGEPGTIGSDEHGGYSYYEPKHILANEDHLSSSMEDNFDDGGRRTSVTGIDVEDVKAAVNWSRVTVMAGSFDKGDVTSELEDNNFENETSHGGFDVYVASNDSEYAGMAVGVKGSKLLFGNQADGSTDAQEVVETAIDVKKGDEERFAQAHDGMKKLMNVLGTVDYVFGRTREPPSQTNEQQGQFEDNVATGFAWKIKGKNSQIKSVYVFEDKSAAETDPVKEYVEQRQDSEESSWSKVDDLSVNKKGTAVVAKGTLPTDEFSF